MNPLHYLKLEWQKFGPNTTFRVLGVLYVVFFALSVWLAFLIGRNFEFNNNGEVIKPAADLFVFPRSWELVAFAGSWMNMLLLGFMGVFLITVELSNRTLRQNIISGLSRKEYFSSKITALLGISALATAVFLALGLLSGFPLADAAGISSIFPSVDLTLRYFLQSFGYLLLGTLAGLFIRQTALATLSYLAYVVFIERISYWILKFTLVKTNTFPAISDALLLLPNKVLSALVPLPIPQMAQQAAGSQKIFDELSPSGVWIAALVYLTLFSFLFFRRLQKADF